MPTGYTADVMDGKISDFNAFALQCARGMGALIIMRDEPWSAPIPERFEPSDYNLKKLGEARAELARLQAMTQDEVDHACEEDRKKRLAERAEWRSREQEQNDRLDAMTRKVQAWEPPTADHTGMKSFMLDQLRISRNNVELIDQFDPIKAQSSSEWHQEKIEKAHKDVGYHASQHAKEVERTESSNAWVKQLRDSLGIESAGATVAILGDTGGTAT